MKSHESNPVRACAVALARAVMHQAGLPLGDIERSPKANGHQSSQQQHLYTRQRHLQRPRLHQAQH